jgi:hypothetical protein
MSSKNGRNRNRNEKKIFTSKKELGYEKEEKEKKKLMNNVGESQSKHH